MLISKTNLFILIALLLNSFFAIGQGCMDGGSDEGATLKGFIQPQYNYMISDDASTDESSFNFNRARIGVVGNIPYDISYYFFTEMSSFKSPDGAPYLLDAFITYSRFANAKISVGQFKSPFSLEQNTGCSGLYTVNRSEVVGQLAGPQRDMGLMVSGGNDTTLIKYAIGFMNGTGMGVDDNNKGKDIVGRIQVNPIKKYFKLGGSFRFGKTVPTDLAQKDNDIVRLGGEIEFKHNNILVQAEYIHGIDELYSTSKVPVYGGCGGIIRYDTKLAGTYQKGGFLIIAAYKTPWNVEPVIKYDSWNPDLDLNDAWKTNLTIGANYYLNDWTRLQVNYVAAREKTEINNDMIMVQCQIKF